MFLSEGGQCKSNHKIEISLECLLQHTFQVNDAYESRAQFDLFIHFETWKLYEALTIHG